MQGYLDPYNSTRSLNTTKPIVEDEEEDENANEEVFDGAGRQRSFYWNDSDFAMASDPSKLFASFRGGLLDIPKSPPKPRHDVKTKPKKKLQLDASQMGELLLPARALSRNSSSDEFMMASAPKKKGQISLAMLAKTLDNLAQDEQEAVTPDYGMQSPQSMVSPVEGEKKKGSLPMGLPLSLGSAGS